MISSTLNQLMLKITSGADYVTKIALLSGKSIPVVHRQLEILKNEGFLDSKRIGKRVSYTINWAAVAGLIAAEMQEYTQTKEKPRVDLQKLIQAFLASQEVKAKLLLFMERMEKAKETISEYRNATMSLTMEAFLEAFARLTPEEMKKTLSEKTRQEHATLLAYLRDRHMMRQSIDPANVFKNISKS